MIRINGGQATLGANTFIGAQVAPSLALGGASLGGNALAVIGVSSVVADTASTANRAQIEANNVRARLISNWGTGSGVPLYLGAGADHWHIATTGTLSTIGGSGLITALDLVATSRVIFGSQGRLLSPSDGVIGLYNTTQLDFNRLQFGGTTSSYPSIKRNATALNFRLADDSADAPITAAAATFSGLTTMAAFAASGTSSVIGSTTIAGAASGNATATFRVFGGLSNSAGFQVAHNSATDASLILNTVAGGTLGIGSNNAAVLTFAATTNAVAISTSLTLGGVLTVPGVTTAALTSTGTFTSGAAAQVGTLTNAPAAGNPTTWIKIIDNGVTRYIPAW